LRSASRLTAQSAARCRISARSCSAYAQARPGDIQRFAVDNTKLRRLGVEFETDWRSIVREVIASLEPTAAATKLLT